MCVYPDVLGEGAVLGVQLATLLSITLSIAFWAWLYRREKVGLMRYAIPIALWVVFGTLDILITAKGTFSDATLEGNPLSRLVFQSVGYLGPVVASILWISFWSGLVLAINKLVKDSRVSGYLSLWVFYGLAFGHLLGFSSWFMPLCAVSRLSWLVLADWPIRFFGVVAAGCVLAAAHFFVSMVMFKPGMKSSTPIKPRSSRKAS